MRLPFDEFQEFLKKAQERMELALVRANAIGELSTLAKQYGLLDLLMETQPSCDYYTQNKRGAKILVLAIALPNVNDWKLRAKKRFGIPPDRIEFIEVKPSFNYKHLEYSNVYSDIIVGPVPHKGTGIGDNSSFLAEATNHPEKYATVHRMIAHGELALSQSAFEKCLAESNFVRECLGQS